MGKFLSGDFGVGGIPIYQIILTSCREDGSLSCKVSKCDAGASCVKNSTGKQESPKITADELKGKTAAEIRALANEKGLVPHPTKLDKWMDPVTGKERLRMDPGHVDKTTGLPYNDPKATVPHHHGYEPDGKTKIVDPSDGNPHFPMQVPNS